MSTHTKKRSFDMSQEEVSPPLCFPPKLIILQKTWGKYQLALIIILQGAGQDSIPKNHRDHNII